MNRRVANVTLATALVVLGVACRSQIQLGDPDAGVVTGTPMGTLDASPRCPGISTRTTVALLDDTSGELRAIAVGGGMLYALFAKSGVNGVQGVLSRVPTSGGALTDIAQVGPDPAGLSLSADGSYAFVAARGSSQIRRVDSAGAVIVVDAGGAPSAVVADDHGGAFWSLPASDTLSAWSFTSGGPAVIATTPRPSSLVRSGTTLYIRGSGTISAFDPTVDAAPRKLADRCDAGAPAVDNQTLYCVDNGAITTVDLATGNSIVLVAAQPGASDVVVGAGRVFWRAAQSPQQSLVMTTPLDGIGGPTVVEGSEASSDPMVLALEGCDLYFNGGRSLVRRGL